MKVTLNKALLHEGRQVQIGEVLDLPDETVKDLGNAVTPVVAKAIAQMNAKTETTKTEGIKPESGKKEATKTETTKAETKE